MNFFYFIFILFQIIACDEPILIDNLNTTKINVAITFTKAQFNQNLQSNLRTCVESLLKHATIDINFYIIGDSQSQLIAQNIFKEVDQNRINYEIITLDVDLLAKKLHHIVSQMQKYFSYSPSSYYGDSLFFLSIGIHKILDPRVDKLIMLDSDLKFKEDIRHLYELFNEFNSNQIIGIARDAQPVYRHLFWKYRNENPHTRVGSPPPNGLTGYNSGVLLLDLSKMRQSSNYNTLIQEESLEKLTQKYYFKGHLGDQDFFTLIGMEHEELIYILPCTWNRQLCKWWKEHGYESIFDEYFTCEGKINILHGNCQTSIDDYELETIEENNFDENEEDDDDDDDYEDYLDSGEDEEYDDDESLDDKIEL